MKRVVFLIIFCTAILLAQSQSSEAGYQGWSIGGGLSLAVPKSHSGFYHYGNTNVGPGLELSSVIRFKLGEAGWLQYAPSISWWGRWSNWEQGGLHQDVSLADWELNFNVTDVRYSPPIPERVIVKPYVGFGLLGFSVSYFREEVEGIGYHNSASDFSPAQNFYVGTEFALENGTWPYIELKVSSGEVRDFLATVGFTVQY